MATESLRSRRHPCRADGIRARPKALLLRLYWAASQTMKWRATSGEWRVTQRNLISSHSSMGTLCLFLCALCVNSFVFSPAGRAQNLDKPLSSIDEEVTGFSFGPGGRLAYSVYRKLKTKQYDLEHDDLWIQEPGGKRRRILEGQKYTRGNTQFSYLVDSFRWSPNGRYLLVQLMVTTVDESGNATNSTQTLLFDDSGHEVRIAKGDNFISDAADATFLPDNNTIAYL